MISSQDTQSTRVNGQALGDSKLKAEIGDEVGGSLTGILLIKPGGSGEVKIQGLVGGPQARNKSGVFGLRLESIGGD